MSQSISAPGINTGPIAGAVVPMSPMRARFIRDMRIRGFRPRTIEAYTGAMRRLTAFYGHRNPARITLEEIHRFQHHLASKAKSWSYFNVTMCGIRFFYRYTEPRDWRVEELPLQKRRQRMPTVFPTA